MSTPSPRAFADLLASAVTEPGILSQAYRQFHHYSLGNQLLAMFQCHERGIALGPIDTFRGWMALGRHVRKGETAITLCMPMSVKRSPKTHRVDADTADDSPEHVTWFVYKRRWFVLAQIEGDAQPEPEIPTWDRDTALSRFDIKEIQFECADGNCLGYSRERSIAINPVNPMPHKTMLHETAHILLGHTAEGVQADSEVTPRSLRECEAESVALLCCAALDLPGVAECRGYIQSWWAQAHEIQVRRPNRVKLYWAVRLPDSPLYGENRARLVLTGFRQAGGRS